MDGSLYSKSVLIGTGVVFTILPMMAVGLRFYARIHSRAKLGADDWIMIPALVSSRRNVIYASVMYAFFRRIKSIFLRII